MKAEIYNLTELVKAHDLNYENGTPLITDTEYDVLYNRLLTYEKEFTEYALEDSPTKRIYTVMIDKLNKVSHTEPLQSLEKVTDGKGLRKFLNQFGDEDQITVGHKEDGLTVKLEYRGGILYQASTRGDGDIGEDITHSIRLLNSVPNHIEYEDNLILRGEAVIDFESFDRINMDGKYKSPRNLVSGSVRTLDSVIAKERGVKVLIFDVLNWEELHHENWDDSYKLLEGLGFNLSEFKTFKNDLKGKEEIVKYCTSFEYSLREKVGHMVDGLVLKVGDYEERKKRGITSKYPKWAVAYKFNSMDATTTLLDVVWTVGKTGQVTPNAVLDPVDIDGVLVGKASLANIANIHARDVRIGDTVVVARANDVIPQVVSSVTELRTGEEKVITLVENCPSCGEKLDNELGKDGKGNEALIPYCRNIECEDQVIRVLENFVSRNAMDIDGLGEETVAILYREGLITGLSSIYKLKDKKDAVLKLDRFGVRKFEKMVKGIEESKEQTLEKVIKGWGIRHIGNNVSEVLTNHYYTWEDLKMAYKTGDLQDYLSKADGIGGTRSKAVMDAMGNSKVVEMMDELHEYGCKLVQPKKEEVGIGLVGNFVLTGTMYKPRGDIKKDIEAMGGKVVGSVTKNTDYLVLGGYDEKVEFEGSKSSKHKKADELRIRVISDKKLQEMMG